MSILKNRGQEGVAVRFAKYQITINGRMKQKQLITTEEIANQMILYIRDSRSKKMLAENTQTLLGNRPKQGLRK